MPDPTTAAEEVDDDAPWIHSCLGVYGTFDPADLDRLLEVTATSGRKGEPKRIGRRVGPKVHDQDWWHYSTEKSHSWDWPGKLHTILDLIGPHRAEFLAFTADLEVEVHLVAGATVSTPVGTIPREVIADLAALGCSLDMDLYCEWEPHDHDEAEALEP
jgi:hypothetical protein